MKRGVVVASDQNMQWLLPWWYGRFSSTNTLPVAFVDLGMDAQMKAWCQSRGEVLALKGSFSDKAPSEQVFKGWEQSYGLSYKTARRAWFQKPLACALSPFDKTLWLDLDCEVLEGLDSIFSFVGGDKEIAVALQDPRAPSEAFRCNGGAVVFMKSSPLIRIWAKLSQSVSHEHWGDDTLLSSVLEKSLSRVSILPEVYNWRISQGLPLHAKVIHWNGEWGKTCIKEHGGLKEALERVRSI